MSPNLSSCSNLMSEYFKEYYQKIKSGEIKACAYLKRELRRLYKDLSDERFIYDTTEAEKRIKFQERFCKQKEAPYYLKPIELMLWQKAFWEILYSFKMADTGLRRFNEVLLVIARKNGKTTCFASDAVYDLFSGDSGANIVCASNNDSQAKLIFDNIGFMKNQIDPSQIIVRQNLVKIRNAIKNVEVFRLSPKRRLDGYNISKTYLDESHDIAEANGQSEVAEACWRGMSSREQPLFLNCTTQGFNRDCYLDHKINYAKQVTDEEIIDDHFFSFIYEQDSEQEVWQDEASWEKSNPSIRYGVKKIEKLRRDVEVAKHDKATRIHLLTKDFDIPQSAAQTWLLLEDFTYKQGFEMADIEDSFVLGAVDLSATTDLTSAKIMTIKPGTKEKLILSHYWIPEAKLTLSDDKEAGAKYEEWAKQGLLTICEGGENDLTLVADWFFILYRDFKLKPFKIGYDQRFAKTFIERCNEYGFETERLAQGRYLSNAMKFLESDLKNHLVNFRNNPVDEWCLGNCCCMVDNYGAIQPVKIPRQNNRRIDGALTFIMIYETYRRFKTEFSALIGENK